MKLTQWGTIDIRSLLVRGKKFSSFGISRETVFPPLNREIAKLLFRIAKNFGLNSIRRIFILEVQRFNTNGFYRENLFPATLLLPARI